MKERKPRPFDLVLIGEHYYCRHHHVMAIWHHKALTDYCALCWMEGYKPKCDIEG